MKIKALNVENVSSLRDVRIPFRPLTILVGPNASGKSNVLGALELFKVLMLNKNLPDKNNLSEWFWAGKDVNTDRLQLHMESEDEPYSDKLSTIEYKIALQIDNPRLSSEELLINDSPIISLKNGTGEIGDEDGGNKTTYSSGELALKSAGAYGNKPVTKKFSEFLKGLEFYNFDPNAIKAGLNAEGGIPSRLDNHGLFLARLLYGWHEAQKDRFQSVNRSLGKYLNFSLDFLEEKEKLCLNEGYQKTIPLTSASDGTLRLLAYYTLLNQEELPPFIAIEEPERSLHPAALQEVAALLQRLSERTQVVITTHSSQLLDSFDRDSLGKDLGVILLSNEKGKGTQVINIEHAQNNSESLQGWIDDFGIGSAIFDSALV
uniref:Predicted ATPase n=1 Tax=Candidatus Kentrum sp. FW TaxID=2126338 RepID=A0A450T1B1_9GAMM|nr:MAG: Predicted ATPase [Candidatus Kentron sp. FW]